MRLCHLATFDVPIKLSELETSDHLDNLVTFCLLRRYISRADLPRLRAFANLTGVNHTILSLYFEIDAGSGNEISDRAREPTGVADPPFGSQPTPFDPKALLDTPASGPNPRKG
jgi:hypothetical protein